MLMRREQWERLEIPEHHRFYIDGAAPNFYGAKLGIKNEALIRNFAMRYLLVAPEELTKAVEKYGEYPTVDMAIALLHVAISRLNYHYPLNLMALEYLEEEDLVRICRGVLSRSQFTEMKFETLWWRSLPLDLEVVMLPETKRANCRAS